MKNIWHNLYFRSDTTNDTIFLLLSEFSSCPRYRIYEYVDGYMKLDYLGDFRNTCYRMVFSPLINAMENGRFIFSPLMMQYSREPLLKTEPWSFDAIEVWEKNITLTRSPLAAKSKVKR